MTVQAHTDDRRLVVLAVLGVVLALTAAMWTLAGCAPKALPEASAPPEAAGAALTVCLGEDLGPLDPQLALDTGELALSRLLYEGLMRPDGAGGWTCGAAESYRLSEDGRTCTLTLRRDALWSDGVPVTAQDFVYAWERLLAPESASPYALDAALWIEGGEASLYGEEGAALGVRALDDKTLEVRLTARCPYLDALLALPALAPRRSEADALYNGPYGLEAAEADVLRLRRSPTYWDRESVLPEEIAVRAYASGEEAVRALRAGELDLSLFYPAEALPALQEEGFARLSPEDCVLYLDLNAAVPPLDDPLVRQALALALDADALNRIARDGSLRALLRPRHVITPHPGEAARLLGRSARPCPEDARALNALGCVALLKGAASYIAGENDWMSASGSVGMAKGGSGDALTGVLGALLAQGYPPETAAWMASEIHGLAGERAAKRLGIVSMTPQDTVDALPDVFQELYGQ